MQPSARDLERLARKYRFLGELRRARARGEEVPARAVFRALAEEFPGAVNELDTLPLDVIDRRADLLEAALAGGALEPWMAWLHGYHALLRAALYIKLRTARDRNPDADRARALAERATAHAGVTVDEAFVREAATPPRGRLNVVVFERLSAIFGAPARDIQRALFPGLRSRLE